MLIIAHRLSTMEGCDSIKISNICLVDKNNLEGYFFMDHGAPRHNLAEVKRLIREGRIVITMVAIAGARELGFFRADIVNTALALESRDFYKSMTAYCDHRLWLDVYRIQTSAGAVYLKLTVEADVVIISFKEL